MTRRMRRREFLGASVPMCLGLGAGLAAARAPAAAPPARTAPGGEPQTMKAGFAAAKITPPPGTTMMGFGGRDMARGCDSIHDDIYARALFVEHAGHQALIVGFDLCFLGRADADRLKGAIGRRIDLAPSRILLNASHSHTGPSVGTWYSAGYLPPDRLYLDELQRATVRAACGARRALRDVTLWAGLARTALPMNRRRKDAEGRVENRPNPGGTVYDRLPLCLFKDPAGKPVCLLFSVSAHPSMMGGFAISAEYPGAAMRLLDKHLGAPASLFLQGVGGDAKPSVIGKGADRWQAGTWEAMQQAGGMVAGEVIAALGGKLVQVAPEIRAASVETHWPLEPAPRRAHFEEIVSSTKPADRKRSVRCLWAARQLALLDRGVKLPASATITAHGLKLGEGLRLFALEGEPVADWGFLIEKFYARGVTFPLGYTNGEGLYLPTSKMLDEGGYEVVSYWEYGYPARLAKGMEDVALKALADLRRGGIT